MQFILFNDSGIKVFTNNKFEIASVQGRYSPLEAGQFVVAANKVAEAFPGIHWRTVRDIVLNNIKFDYDKV